ncbi:MAG: hypothetical protein WC846_05540 [Candidatus Gracilibacteria bacterium]|jgi:hypothetical protein
MAKMADDAQVLVEVGRFKDLETLIGLLNKAQMGFSYRLEPADGVRGHYLFVEDEEKADSYSCGMVFKMGAKAYALSDDVHKMIMNAYLRFKKLQ